MANLLMDEITALLIKYIAGSASQEESVRVEAWLDEDPANETEYLALEQTWRDASLGGQSRLLDANPAFEKLRTRLGLSVDRDRQFEKELPARRERRIDIQRLFRMAAVFIGLLVLAAGLYYWRLGDRGSGGAMKRVAETIIVPRGQKKHVLLPDGTDLWLNAGSALSVDAGFGASNRHVFLDGEGFFKVRHDSNLVFVVETRNYTIRDIGTEFNLNTYAGDSHFEAAVMEGAISVEGRFSGNVTASRILLSRNQVLKIRKDSTATTGDTLQPQDAGRQGDEMAVKTEPLVSVTRSSGVEKYAGWKEDQLSFDDDAFLDIANKLERRYNVIIRIEDTRLANYHYTGNFKGLADIKAALNILQETTPLIYEMRKDTVIMRMRP